MTVVIISWSTGGPVRPADSRRTDGRDRRLLPRQISWLVWKSSWAREKRGSPRCCFSYKQHTYNVKDTAHKHVSGSSVVPLRHRCEAEGEKLEWNSKPSLLLLHQGEWRRRVCLRSSSAGRRAQANSDGSVLWGWVCFCASVWVWEVLQCRTWRTVRER